MAATFKYHDLKITILYIKQFILKSYIRDQLSCFIKVQPKCFTPLYEYLIRWFKRNIKIAQ